MLWLTKEKKVSIILRKALRTPENLICIAFASVFLPYLLTGVLLAVIGFYLLFSRSTRKGIFIHSGHTAMVIFSLYTALVGIIRDNYIGVACSLGFFLMLVISYYARTEMTGDIFHKALDVCCWMCVAVFVSVVGERLIYSHIDNYRCVGWFFNSNYLCSMMAMMIIVCAYKVIACQKSKLFYYTIALMCAVSMYLGGSIFAIIEVVVGIFTLLILYKKHAPLAAALFFIAIAMVALYFFPDIFPRILDSGTSTEQRIKVWDSSVEFIKISPMFGHGFLSYYHLHNLLGSMWNTTHTHNFAFEPILSFGIIGTVIFVIFVWSYYEKVSECKALLRRNKAVNLILAVSAATIIHCTVDLTVMWIQNGLFFVLLLSGIGIDEKALNRRIKACLAKSEKNKSSEEELNNG